MVADLVVVYLEVVGLMVVDLDAVGQKKSTMEAETPFIGDLVTVIM